VAPAPAALLNAVNAFCLAHVAAVARWGAGLPGAALPVGIGSPGALGLTYAAGAALLWGLGRASRRARSALAGAAAAGVAGLVAALALLAAPPGPPRHFTATFLDVGQGDATLLQAPGGGTVLVDAGPPGAGVVRKLRERGVGALDVAVLTHAQEDHQGDLPEVLRALHVGVLVDGGLPGDGAAHREIVALARARGTRVVRATKGARLRVGRGLVLRVLHGPGDAAGEEDPNLRAAVLLASYRGLDVFLPADAESEVTSALAPPPVEIVKVAHHGSEDEGLPRLLDALRPRVAVIEVGRHNRFGHPHPATLAALRKAVPSVLRTDRDGDVNVTLEGGRLKVGRGG
jgi:competence protein ComEC